MAVLKWQDKRYVKMPAICHKDNVIAVISNGVFDFVGDKSPVDVTDQLAS